MKKPTKLYSCIVFLLCSSNSLASYTCKDSNGNISFQDKPCLDNTKASSKIEAKSLTESEKLSKWMKQPPQKSIVVSERNSGVIHFVASSNLITTMNSNTTILNVDYRDVPKQIWEFEGDETAGSIINVSCKKTISELPPKLEEYAVDRVSKMSENKVKDRILKQLKSDQVFIMVCEAGKNTFSTYTAITIPNDSTCPTIFSNEHGVISAAHIGLFKKDNLMIISVPLLDEC